MPTLPDSQTLETELLTLIGGRLLVLPDGFKPGDDLHDAGLDSMAIMQLLVLLEEKYGVSLPDEALSTENFRSAEKLSRLLAEHAADK